MKMNKEKKNKSYCKYCDNYKSCIDEPRGECLYCIRGSFKNARKFCYYDQQINILIVILIAVLSLAFKTDKLLYLTAAPVSFIVCSVITDIRFFDLEMDVKRLQLEEEDNNEK